MNDRFKDAIQITTARAINQRNKEFWENRNKKTDLTWNAIVKENSSLTINEEIKITINKKKPQEKEPAKKKVIKVPDYNKRSIEF